MKNHQRFQLLRGILSAIIIFVQFALPVAGIASDYNQQALTDQKRKNQAREWHEQWMTPQDMRLIFDRLLAELPQGSSLFEDSQQAFNLMLADAEAIYQVHMEQPLSRVMQRQGYRFSDRPFPSVTLTSLNQAFMAIVMTYLNFPPGLTEAEQKQADEAFSTGMFALSFHYLALAEQGLLEDAGQETDEGWAMPLHSLVESEQEEVEKLPPVGGKPSLPRYAVYMEKDVITPDTVETWLNSSHPLDDPAQAMAVSAETTLVAEVGLPGEQDDLHWRGKDEILPGEAGIAQSLETHSTRSINPVTSAVELLPQAMTPEFPKVEYQPPRAATESRAYGNLRITANTFTDMGGGVTRAMGNVTLGVNGAVEDSLALTGGSDWVSVEGTSLMGTGTLAQCTGGLAVYRGEFSANGSQTVPVVQPGSGVVLINQLGDFPVSGSATLTKIDLASGEASGMAQVEVDAPGISKTLDVAYLLSPGQVVGGQVSDFEVQVAGSQIQVSGAWLTNEQILSNAANLTLPAHLGGGNGVVQDFALKPDELIFGGGSGIYIPIPDILIGSGEVVKFTGLSARLAQQSGVYIFSILGDLILHLPGIEQTDQVGFEIDTHGNVRGTINRLELLFIGCRLVMENLEISNQSLAAGKATLKLPESLGGISGEVEGVVITIHGLSIADGRIFNIPDIVFGTGEHIKITNLGAKVQVDGDRYVLSANGRLIINLFSDHLNIAVQVNLDNGELSGVISTLEMTLVGVRFSMTDLLITNQGVFVEQAILTLPGFFHSTQISVNDIAFTRDGISLNGGVMISLPDINFGGSTIIQIKKISGKLEIRSGVYVFTLHGEIHIDAHEYIHSAISLDFLIDSQGYMSGTLESLDLLVAGFELQLNQVILDSNGLNADAAVLSLPAMFGGASIGVQDVSITRDGISIGCGVIALPEIKFGAGKLKIINATVVIVNTDQGIIFDARGSLVVNLPGNEQTIQLTFSVDTDGNFSGQVSQFSITIGGGQLAFSGISLINDGLVILEAQFMLQTSFGEIRATLHDLSITGSGLHFNSSQVTFPDIVINSHITLSGVRVSLHETTEGYALDVTATLVITLPSNNQRVTFDFIIDTEGHFSGSISSLNFSLAGCNLVVENASLGDSGFQLGLAELILPSWLGGLKISVSGLSITDEGLRIHGGVTLSLPDIVIAAGKVQLTHLTGQIQEVGNQYVLAITGTLEITLPSNHLNFPILFTLDHLGSISGTLQNLDLVFAGCTLNMTNITLNNQGLSVASGRFALPEHLGSVVATLSNIAIGKDGLTINGGFAFNIPVIPFGSGKHVKLFDSSLKITQSKSGGVTVYIFSIETTLAISLPENSLSIPLHLTLDTQGNVVGSITQIRLNLAGCTLEMKNISISNQGLDVEIASLKLPAFLDHAVITLYKVMIHVDDGLQIGGAIRLPEFWIGKTVHFQNLYATLATEVSIGKGLVFKFGVQGSLTIFLGNSSNVFQFSAAIDSNGNFSGTLDHLQIKFSGFELKLVNVKVNSERLSIGQGTLVVKGYINVTVFNVVIDGNIPFIHFTWSATSRAVADNHVNLPDVAIGGEDGFILRDGQLVLDLGEDGNYFVRMTGNLNIEVGNQSALVPAEVEIDSFGRTRGSVLTFDLQVGGLLLTIPQAMIVENQVIAAQGEFRLPEEWGGAAAVVYQVILEPQQLKIGKSEFALPDVRTNGVILTNLKGVLVREGDIYRIEAAGFLLIPNLGGSEKGLRVYVQFVETAAGSLSIKIHEIGVDGKVAGKKLPVDVEQLIGQISCPEAGCTISIGQSGLSLTSLSGEINLVSEANLLDLMVSISGGPNLEGVPAIKGSGLTAILQAQPFRMDLAGVMDLFSMHVGSESEATFENGYLHTHMMVDMEEVNGWTNYSIWNLDGDFHLNGSGELIYQADRGSMHSSCYEYLCIDFPTENESFEITHQFGNFAGTGWGLAGFSQWAPKPPHNFAIGIDRFIDEDSMMSSRNKQTLLSVNSTDLTGETTMKNVDLAKPSDLFFLMARMGDTPTMTLISPTGIEYSPDQLSEQLSYQMFIMTDTITTQLGVTEVITYNQELYAGSQLEAGSWVVKLFGEPPDEEIFLVNVVGLSGGAKLKNVWAQNIGDRTVQVGWSLTTDNPDSRLNIYVSPAAITQTVRVGGSIQEPITSTQKIFSGILVAENVHTHLDGSPSTTFLDMSWLKSGEYYIWLELNDIKTPPVREVAATPVMVKAAWQTSWSARLSVASSYRALDLSWRACPNSDTNRYQLLVDMEGGAPWTVDLGDVHSTRLSNLSPGIPYTLTLQAVGVDVGQVATAETMVGIPGGAPFSISPLTGNIELTAGETTWFDVLVTTPMSEYPEMVHLTESSMPDGLALFPVTPWITPTREGVLVSVAISSTSILAGGVYTGELAVSGANQQTLLPINFQVQERDFTLDIDPAQVVLIEGESLTMTLAIGQVNGFDLPVQLRLDSIPEGLAIQYDSIVLPGDSIPLVISDTQILSAGIYTMTLNASDGIHEHREEILLHVEKKDFSLNADIIQQDINPGETISYTLEIGSLGWSDGIQLTVGENTLLPEGVTIGFVTSPEGELYESIQVYAPIQVYLVVITPVNTPAGAFHIHLEAESQEKKRQEDLYLQVNVLYRVLIPMLLLLGG